MRRSSRPPLRSPLSLFPVRLPLLPSDEQQTVDPDEAASTLVFSPPPLTSPSSVQISGQLIENSTSNAAHSNSSPISSNAPISPYIGSNNHFDVTTTIKQFKLFQDAPDDLVDAIAVHLVSRVVGQGDEICREGEDAKAMYWIIKGDVAVVSRDGESKYAELHAGAFFGEIGVLFAVPRTASIIATSKCLLLALTREDLHMVLPKFPAVERAIREEAQERLELLNKQRSKAVTIPSTSLRERIQAVPMFRELPADILHFLGLKIKPAVYRPFAPIVVQDTPGREIYFIISGVVEVIDAPSAKILARLGPGQFFGELAWLSISPLRTASVRSISNVEVILLEGSVLEEVSKIYPEMRRSIERVANDRMRGVFIMSKGTRPEGQVGAGSLATMADQDPFTKPRRKRKEAALPTRTSPRTSPRTSTKRQAAAGISGITDCHGTEMTTTNIPVTSTAREDHRKRIRRKEADTAPFAGRLPHSVLANIVACLPLIDAVKLRVIHSTWNQLLLTVPLPYLLLSRYSRLINDTSLVHIATFAGNRPQVIDISHCSHLTDPSFQHMTTLCAASVVSVSLASCWNISSPALVDLAVRAPNLRTLNLSNCRKISDLALYNILTTARNLEELDLGYCKHISDRSMHTIAAHASTRLKTLKLARCTSITDAGFATWTYAPSGFPNLTTLVLRDCTFLSDNAIVALTNSCSALQHLDLSFCCNLSDTSVEVLALGLPSLRKLFLAFCGSAVSDSSLRSIGLHLQALKQLSVRGCVRVTNEGVKNVLSGIDSLRLLDVSQCRNFAGVDGRKEVEIIRGG